nr:hypothetical protein [Tanacetum cinerariifolium]
MRPPLRFSGPRPHGNSMRPPFRPAGHRPHGPSMNPKRPTMNGARPYKTFFQTPSFETRPFLKSSAVKNSYRAPWVPTVNRYVPPVNRKFSTGRRNFPTANRKFPTASRKFTTGNIKNHTVDIGRKGKAVKPSACWTWNPSQELSNKGPNNNSVSVMFKKYTYIDTQGRLKKPSKVSKVKGNQRNWNNLKSQQLGENFVMKNKACFNCGHFDHLSYDCGLEVKNRRSWAKTNNTRKSMSPRPAIHRPYRPPMRHVRPNMNVAQPKRTSFHTPTHLYNKRPFQRTSAVRSQFRDPRVTTVNRKFPTVNIKLPTGNTKFSTADMGNKGKAVKASACWFWKPSQNLSNKSPNSNSVSVMFKKYTYIDTQGRLNGCSRYITGNISYLTDYEPYDGGYVSFGQSGCKITGKRTIKTGKQHKASCKTKLVNSMTKPLHTLHMDLFGPTSTFFLKTKDETSGILKNFITEIENLKELKVKIIKCDNGGEFRNKEMNDFCLMKWIKREFSNARTPQQNRVAKRRNRTLIEAARTMVLVNMSQNKTPYELFNGRTPAIGFLKPFGCHVILNTLDHLGKFEAKGDEGYFIGYSMSSKAFR